MPSRPALLETRLEGLTLHRRGKVRDVYEVGDDLLIVATDRISAFDFVLGSGIPDKGKVLTQMSAFWFETLGDVVPNHVIAVDADAYPEPARRHADVLRGRSMLVRRTDAVSRRVRGARLPVRLGLEGIPAGRDGCAASSCRPGCGSPIGCPRPSSRRRPRPRAATTSTFRRPRPGRIVGAERIARLRDLTLELYARGARHAEGRGIIVADTKFEFGVATDPATGAEAVILIDEALTPDSSRFWPRDQYAPGRGQPSFDKQYVRDYLEQIGWNKQPPVPTLPDDVVARTREKYLEAFHLITGRELR